MAVRAANCKQCTCVIGNYWQCKNKWCANYTPPDPPKASRRDPDKTPVTKPACDHRMVYLGSHGSAYGLWCNDCGKYLKDVSMEEIMRGTVSLDGIN